MEGSVNATSVTVMPDTGVSGCRDSLTAAVIVALYDENAAGTVNITIDMSALSAADVMIGMSLNSDPAKDPAGMTLTHTGARAGAGISSGIDCCKPDGQGDHDVQIDFPRAAADRFSGGEA
jgi:hypothetical protein